jgi:GxxExxY protein
MNTDKDNSERTLKGSLCSSNSRDIHRAQELLHEDLTHKIIGCAMKVLNELKPGLDEKLYENALLIELRDAQISVEQQKEFSVQYRGHFVGKLIPDLIVGNKVIVDPKVVAAFNDTHTAQMIGYLAITGLKVALLLNFKHAKLDWKRVVRERITPGSAEPGGDFRL